MIELEPATTTLAALVNGVRDDQLSLPTPCDGFAVAALLNHIDEMALTSIHAATKTIPESGPASPSEASHLADNWRERIPTRLNTLANAWRNEAAWTGITQAGGFTFAGDVAGLVVLGELLLHGWDVARSSGQVFTSEPPLLEAAFGAMQASVSRNPNGIPGVFGAPVQVSDDAGLLERLIGLSGRNPVWTPNLAAL
jgi:uncharacterized protein (TIGR03086 family)